jgi:hypothetical protein
MTTDYFYSRKIPQKRELTTAYYLATFTSFMILLLIFFFMKGNLAEKAVFLTIIFSFFMIVIRLILIKSLVIKRIDQVMMENSALLRKDKKYEGLLLQSDISYVEYRKKERVITIILVLGFVFLFKLINGYALDKSLIPWSYLFTVLAFQALHISLNIFKYLSAVIQSCIQKIVQKDFLDFKGKDILPDLNNYIKKTKLFLLFLLFIVTITTITIIFLKEEGLLFLPIPLLFLLGPIIFNVNSVINRIMPVFEEYDNFAKAQLGLSFQPNSRDQNFAELAGDMTKDIKDLFR